MRTFRHREMAGVLALATAIAAAGGGPVRGDATTTRGLGELAAGIPVVQAIAPGEVHRWRLRLAPGELMRMRVEQRGADVAIALRDSSGAELWASDDAT